MKKLLLVMLLQSVTHAITAPYIINATATDYRTIQLTWRNNSANTQGYVIHRADEAGGIFHFVDSIKTALQDSYSDTIALQPQTRYNYKMFAYGEDSLSVASNTVQATTPTLPRVFVKPLVGAHWDFSASESVTLDIDDSSNCEKGYLLYRMDGLNTHYQLVSEIKSAHAPSMGRLTHKDSNIRYNAWFSYKVAVFTDSDTLFSEPCTTFTSRYAPATQVTKLEKIGNFPLNVSGWSALAGDSIIVQEQNAPQGMYSIINIGDRRNPRFDGYIDSVKLLSYPMQTLVPLYLRYGVANTAQQINVMMSGERVLMLHGGALGMYQIQGNELRTVDVLPDFPGNTIHLLNDSSIVAIKPISVYTFRYGQTIVFTPLALTADGISTLPSRTLGLMSSSSMNYSSSDPYIQGIVNGNVLISVDNFHGVPYNTTYQHNQLAYNYSTGAAVMLTGAMPYANAQNTGRMLSDKESLCLARVTSASTQLFISDGGDSYPYTTAEKNGSMYNDTTLSQNKMKNILLDTLSKHIYLVYERNLVVLRYYHGEVGITRNHRTASNAGALKVLAETSTKRVTITLPHSEQSFDIAFYDLSGRCVKRMSNVTTPAVQWSSSGMSSKFLVVVAQSKGMRYCERFMMP